MATPFNQAFHQPEGLIERLGWIGRIRLRKTKPETFGDSPRLPKIGGGHFEFARLFSYPFLTLLIVSLVTQ
jgi:hypothetical protein